MHRCYVEPSQWHAASIVLDAAETHHALRVLRIRDGEPVELFDGRGRTAKAVLKTGAGTRRAASAFAEPVESPRLIAPPPVFITLLQAIPKARRMDLVVEKATELGAMRIIPVRTERVVASPDEIRGGERRERWARLAVNAARQCATAWLPEVDEPRSLADALAVVDDGQPLFVGSLAASARPFRQVVASVRARLPAPERAAILIGPEGDLSDAEREEARAMGAMEVSFGRRVLRTETAAFFGLSVLGYEFLSDESRD